MTFGQATLLGIVQGLTEFFPVSSSGHLVIVQSVLGLKEMVFFDAMLHLGTLLAVVWCFRQIIIDLVRSLEGLKPGGGGFSGPYRDRLWLIVLLLVSTVVTAIPGLALKSKFEALFENVPAVAVAFIITGLFLLSTKWIPAKRPLKTMGQLTLFMAVVVGLAQLVAITPGISRSGATIVAALWLGYERKLAVEYSFLLAIPAIIGADVVKLLKDVPDAPWSMLLWGMLMAFCAGMVSLVLVKRLVLAGHLHRFAFYLIPLGLVILGVLASR